MKTLALLLLILSFGYCSAEEVALLSVRFPNDKTLHQVVIGFYEQDAPVTVENFKKLARKRFYNGQSFHRAFPHILVQVGDPLSRKKAREKVGTGGPGYTLPPEIRRKHSAGSVAMARLPDKTNPGRLSNGSQFYVTLKPMPEFDGKYTVFGKVLSGMEVLDRVSTQRADSNDNPVEKVVLKSVKIVPQEKAGTGTKTSWIPFF